MGTQFPHKLLKAFSTKSVTGYRNVRRHSTLGNTPPDTMLLVYLLGILRGPIVEQFLSVCALFRDVEDIDVVFG